MKTDTLLYDLFLHAPGTLFELLGQSADLAKDYEFRSVEVKQLAFRIDGVFLPKPEAEDQTVIFLECQFQNDPLFYHRFWAEIANYIKQYPQTVDWKAVVLFANRAAEPSHRQLVRSFVYCDQVQRIYLDDFKGVPSDRWGVQIVQLILATPDESVAIARNLLSQTQQKVQGQPELVAMLDLIETIIVYKFPQLSREAIAAMLSLSELKQTRVYQEAKEEGRTEGRTEGELSIVLKQLNRRLGVLPESIEAQVRALSLTQVEALGEALLDFSTLADLNAWLKSFA